MTAVTLVMGAGGVGKTTVAAGLAALASRRGRQTLVITVDPARRLADALGAPAGDTPTPVPGMPRLHASMVDAAASWEATVRQHADPATAERLLSNPFFRAVADRFPAGQSYAAAEEVTRHTASGDFEVIVVDTPPSEGGLEFLSAPESMRSLVAGRALRLLTGARIPGRRLFYSVTTRPALRIADSILGGRLLEDVAEFLIDLSTIYGGVARRSREVEEVLRAASPVAVATPETHAVHEVERMLGHTGWPVPPVVVLNRMLPADWAKAGAGSGPLAINVSRWRAEARRHESLRRALAATTGAEPAVLPWLATPPDTPDALADMIEAAGLQVA
ncbi:MAG: ArsA-related P-loop ATPase [Acidimicrobiia bacterium]|nr:MAG: ArsA-related P-loop ATPase [Acidimicrobiia bacterium]